MATNPPFITNLSYRDYVSEKELKQSKYNIPRVPTQTREVYTSRKTPFFNYYDSTVRNSHLHPSLRTTFIKVYTPPKKPAKSQLLNDIDRKASRVPNKLLPSWE